MTESRNPFGDDYFHLNSSSHTFSQNGSIGENANASSTHLMANDSCNSLLDPAFMPELKASRLDSAFFRTRGVSDSALLSNSTPTHQHGDEARKMGQKPSKIIAPIRIPRASDPGNHDSSRSSRIGLSSATLASSFPMPPPRTPATPSQSSTVGSHSSHARTNSNAISGSGNSSPEHHRNNNNPSPRQGNYTPRAYLPPPPPSPAATASRTATPAGEDWHSTSPPHRSQEAHPMSLPYYSPDPAARTLHPSHKDPASRIKSFAAELSTPISSVPVSPVYPPRAYSPANACEVSRAGEMPAFGSPSRFGASLPPSPASSESRLPATSRAQEEHGRDRNSRARRRESSGTFGTVISSAPSIGMSQAIHTLENEDFESSGTRTTAHTRNHSEISIASSSAITHELVRHGNVLKAYPYHSPAQEASRRLTRASLVSSELLRSAKSAEALRGASLEDAANQWEPEQRNFLSRPPTRIRDSYRYSSGPAPTLASLAEDEDDGYLSPASPEISKRRSSRHHGTKRPDSSRRDSDWASKSVQSTTSHRTAKSSGHFTVASHAPSIPTLHKPEVHGQIAAIEGSIPLSKLAKRATVLGEILDNKPEQDIYQSYPADGSRQSSYDELRELRYSNQIRKARRSMKAGMPNMWSRHTPIDSASTGTGSAHMPTLSETYSSETTYNVHPSAKMGMHHVRRRKSYPASQLHEIMSTNAEKASSSGAFDRSSFSSSGSQDEEPPHGKQLSYWKTLPPQKKRKIRLAIILFVCLAVAAAVGLAIPLSKHSGVGQTTCEKNCSNHGSAVMVDGECSCQCQGSFNGPFCDFDTTCVCPDGTAECSEPLAKSLLTTASYASTLFAPPVNTTRLAALLSQQPGTAPNDCSWHTNYIETDNLDPTRYKSRRRWTQALLLWDLASSEDLSNRALAVFQNSLSYWHWQDSPSFQAQPTFQSNSHGYSIDFAFQKVFVPPKSLSDLGVSTIGSTRLNNVTALALERVGAFAVAASTQRASALVKLFTKLGYTGSHLVAFRKAVASAPIYFPFDINAEGGSEATLSVARSQADNGRGFPIPPACLAGLSESQLAELNRVENNIYNLPQAPSLANLEVDCPERPLYGILNFLNLQLPFLESSRMQQAAVISNQEQKSRMTLHNGQLPTPLAYSGTLNTSSVNTASFGTVKDFDNVIYDVLSQLPSEDASKALIDYLLSGSQAAPGSSTDLAAITADLQEIPVVEVQLWGPLLFSDIDYVVSGLASSAGAMLFGSSQGTDLRNWAHRNGDVKTIRWSLNARSERYAADDGSNLDLNRVWEASATISADAVYQALDGSNLLAS